MSKFKGLRKFGLSIVGEVPWGTHLCEFYQTKEDLIDILVPYFKAGLENNEFCMWVTAEPLNEEEAKKALEKSLPNLSEYLERGQIEIISYKDWYVKDGGFNSDRVLQGWVSKLENALGKGFAGLRLTGNPFWLEKSDWKAFTDYEEAVNNVIGQYKMIAVCTYSLDKCNAHEILDVMKNHQFALVKRSGKWELIESSEKKKIADDLLKSERKFTALYDAMTEGVVIHDIVYDDSGNPVDYVITDVNPSYEKITGLSKKEAVGKKASELYGTGAPPYLDVYAKVASSGKPTSFETYFPPMQKHFSASVFSQSKGKFTTVFFDITERKRADEALRASEHRWATTLSSIGDAVIATDIAGKITFMNHVAEGLTGWTLTEASQKPLKEVFNIINEHTHHEVDNPVARVLEKGLIIGLANHTLLICKDGTEIPIDDSGAPIKDEKGEIIGVVLVFRDIAERRKMEAELSNLAKFPSENHNVILRLSKDGKLLYSNPASKRLLGNWLENLNLSLPEHWRKNLTETLSSGKKLGFEEQIRESTFSFTFAPIVSEGYVNVYGEDITERKLAEEEIKRLNTFQKRVFESIKDELMVIDIRDFRVLAANNALLNNVMMKEEEVIGKQCYAVTHHNSTRCSPPNHTCPITEMLRTGEPIIVEHTHFDSEGNPYYVEVSASPVTDKERNIVQAVHLARDITARKKAEATLVESERRYRSLFANMNSGFAFCKIVSDNDGKPIDYVILEVNDDFEKLTRLKKEAVLGKRISEVFFSIEKDPTDWIGIYGRVATTGEPARFESYFELLKKWFSVAAYMPEIGYFAMAFDDITEHKKAEEVLLESEERLNRSQEIAHLGSWELDLTNNRLTWSDEVYRIFGLKPQEFGATYEAFLDAVHPEDRAAVDAAYSGSLREGRDTYEIEHRVVRKSTGEIRIVYEKCNHIRDGAGRIIRSVGMVHDITDRKKAEESLEKEQQELNRIIDSSPIIIFYKDKEGKFIRVNEAFAEALKIPKEKFLGKTVFHLYSAEMARGMANDDLEVLKSGRPKLGIIEQYESASGMRWVQTDKVPILDKNGISAGLVGFALDITERKKAERELVDTLEASHRRQAEVSALLGASKAVLVHREFSKAARSIFDSCKDLLGATAGYVALLSRDKMENEVLFLDSGGLPCVVDPSLPMPIRGLRAEAYSTGKVVYCNDFSSSEWVSLMPKGHVVLKNVLFAPLTIDDNTVGIIGLANKTDDFTERDAQMASAFGEIASVALINSQMLEKLEENEKLLKAHSERLEEMVEEKTKLLRDSERLAAIGQTAGMVGHDIRNPLQAIIGDVYLAKSDVASMLESEKKESLRESLDSVEKNAQYISKIVADLQDYARPMKPFAQTIDLENIIRDLLLKNDIPKGIKVSCRVENDCKQIVADPDLLKRVLSNLLTNAVQAMPEGGELDVHAFRDTNDNVITVADTGVGIPEQAKGNLFTPLFTTKSKGQGFGLAVVKRITEAMGGTVTFESQEGKGSKFTLRLPQKT